MLEHVLEDVQCECTGKFLHYSRGLATPNSIRKLNEMTGTDKDLHRNRENYI